MPNSRPPWLKDRLETVNKNVPPAWTRKASATPATDTKESSPSAKSKSIEETPAASTKAPVTASTGIKKSVNPPVKENGETGAKTTATGKLQSKEIKVPVLVAQKKPVNPPPSKSDASPVLKNTTPVMTVHREAAKPKTKSVLKEPTPEPDEEDEDEYEEEEEEEEEEEGSTEYETETESEEEVSPPPPVKSAPKKPDPSELKRQDAVSAQSPKLPVQLRKVTPTKSPEKSDTDSKPTSKSVSEKSSSPESNTFVRPPLKKVVRPQQDAPPKERSASPEPAKNFRVQLRKVPSNLKAPRVKEKLPEVQLKKVEKPLLEDIPKKEEAYPHKPSMLKSESSKRIPPPPPMPKSNIPPPPPPPPGMKPPPDFKKQEISDKQLEVLDKLKRRPRRRPDWSDMMKEVEKGKKLRHVQCNDRSHPIINSKSITKVKDQFIFETEKATAHNQLLKQIQGGIQLKPTKCNDRSKPILEGLRKFRRQMTLEEQLAKSESRANLEAPPADEEEDELDDIDKVRDDLQSTKQMLAHELRNNEALERENKRLLVRVQNLEAELSRERWNPLSGEERTTVTGPQSDLIQSLKDEALEAQNQSKQLEDKYQTVAKELDTAYKQVDEQKRKLAELERKLQCLTDDDFYLSEQQGVTDDRRATESAQKESSPELQPEEEEEEEDEEDEEKKAEKIAKRLNREVNMLQARLTRLKEKQEEKHAERQALKYAMKTNQYALKAEKKKYKKLQKEVEKMAAMMKMEDDDDDAAEPKEPAVDDPEDEEQEEEEEEESESEESESESENESENEAEDAPDAKKKINLDPRVKRHEARLASLKKGNYLLQANVDRIKDEISKVREECCTLQTDLDNVIADLG
ncbi:DNA ligase 1 [Anopheles nili]|uniref:DNA ligase 1 n=1 Tax=Anopheles nili TaxID=185578 RepID=UPI00237A812F|nr:DNA ligase 1 [Anopheles nili]